MWGLLRLAPTRYVMTLESNNASPADQPLTHESGMVCETKT